jgi:outer membrane protein TolC
MREAAAREHEQRLREARAEVAEARRAVEAATRGAVAARAAADAAEEAARLMRRRFEEGMTTTADLLDAEARAAQLRTGTVNAELMRHLAAARLAFLTDTDTEHLRGGMDR